MANIHHLTSHSAPHCSTTPKS